jgi:hypothetical protein
MSARVNTEKVSRPGISSETLERLKIRHVMKAEAKELFGQEFAGIYIPYGIVVDGKPFGRLRLDVVQPDRKYTQRAGSGVHSYIPNFPDLVRQPDLVIVEGEFKAIALCEAGFRAIGISGFYGFKNEDELCPWLRNQLKQYPPSRILFLGDNDTALNYQFSDAAMKLVSLVAPLQVVLPRNCWPIHKARTNREHAVFAWNWTRCLDIHRDVGFWFHHVRLRAAASGGRFMFRRQ